MEIVKGLKRNKIVGAGDVIKISFVDTDTENEEALFIKREEHYVIVVPDPGVGKYRLVNLESGSIVISIDFDSDICDELNARVDDWEFIDAKLNVSK